MEEMRGVVPAGAGQVTTICRGKPGYTEEKQNKNLQFPKIPVAPEGARDSKALKITRTFCVLLLPWRREFHTRRGW